MRALTDATPELLAARLSAWGHNPSHAPRILSHLYRSGGQLDLQRLKVGPRLSEHLVQQLPARQASVCARTRGADGTVKLLVEFALGGSVEAVMMPLQHAQRAAGCVSSQVGCAMGCDFCASARGGLSRNLTAGEIVEQFLFLKREASSAQRRLSSVVFMGMGEPLHNFEAVVEAIRRITSPRLGALAARNIKVGTVGIVPEIDRLAEADLGVHLAVSLHAADDATRGRIVPPTRRWGVQAIVAATRRFVDRTGRIPTVGYCLLAGINDRDEQAEALADLVGDLRAHVNLIPYNAIGAGLSGEFYQAPPFATTRRFLGILRRRGLYARVRRTLGDDVGAACGQLRRSTPIAGAPAPLNDERDGATIAEVPRWSR